MGQPDLRTDHLKLQMLRETEASGDCPCLRGAMGYHLAPVTHPPPLVTAGIGAGSPDRRLCVPYPWLVRGLGFHQVLFK